MERHGLYVAMLGGPPSFLQWAMLTDNYPIPNKRLRLARYVGLTQIFTSVQYSSTLCAVWPFRNNYKDYSMESRTHFRVHAALAKLKADQEEITHL